MATRRAPADPAAPAPRRALRALAGLTATEHPNVARVRAAAVALGIDVEIRRFPASTRTAADAAREIGCALGQIIKSLVFFADGEPVLVLCAGVDRVDETRLAGHLGAGGVRRANANEARAATGFPIGGVPPFGHPRPLRVVVDRGLLRYEELWSGAGLPEAVMRIRSADLARASGGEVGEIAAR